MLGDLRATIHHILKETKYIFAEVNKYMHHLPFGTNSQRPPKVVHHIKHAHSTNSQRSPKFLHQLSHIRIGLECCTPFGTYSQRPPNVVHHLAHIRRGLRKLCTTWHILLGSPSILREACQSFFY